MGGWKHMTRRTYLMGLMGGPGSGPRRGARLTPFPATLHGPFGILPHQVPPHPRDVLKPVAWVGGRAGSGPRPQLRSQPPQARTHSS